MATRLLVAVGWLITIIQWALIIRAIASWFQSFAPAAGIYSAMCVLTEPVVAPVRSLMMKVPQLMSTPFDLSVFFAYLLLELVRILLL